MESYPYGFNGQEKDDEIAAGIYTALYWEYDSRLGRRWNLDVVKKPWQSDYVCFSNSPIWKVDPNGDDDYFSSDGKFLYSDNNKESRIIFIVNDKGVKTQLKEYFFNKDNAKTLANIGGYYAQFAGLDLNKLGGKSLSVSLREWTSNTSGQIQPKSTSLYNHGKVSTGDDIMNHDDKTNRISITLDAGKICPLLNDGNNMISVLKHEKTHGDFTTNDGFEHLNVYFQQVTDPNFKNTTKDFKLTIFSNIREIVALAETYEDKNLTEEQNKAVRAEGAKWRKKFEGVNGVYKK
ncbi:MAG: hypothetical protein JST26_19265 [Bacteroidetes bacterium]|nr:hypothetical protein [Bacteroidota bacterium]